MRYLLPLYTVLLLVGSTRGDEGMWLFNNPPHELLKTRYGCELKAEWLDRVMKASLRFPSGSGAIVSPQGLCVTNHHVASAILQKLSKAGQDYHRDGFLAAAPAQELKCPGLELIALQSIADVTAPVQEAVQPGMSPDAAAAARQRVIASIESAAKAKTGLRSNVVTLYQGGLYHLYLYKKWTDIRLVFAPEEAIANFGGDVDNFEYPRFCLDVCFLRLYEEGKPASTPYYLKWSPTGPSDGELVFVSGHPGSTNRQETLARLVHRRDFTLPYLLARLRYQENTLFRYAERGAEEARHASIALYSAANARKFITGQYQGLLTPKIVDQKRRAEANFVATIGATALPGDLQAIVDCQKKLEQFEKAYQLLELGDAFFCRHFALARHLVRLAVELPKASTERLPEYRDTALDSLKLQLFTPTPIHPELEAVKLTASLTFLAEQLRGDHPLVKKVLTENPGVLAERLVRGTQLGDVAVRQQLFAGGAKAVAASTDPMIQFARLIDADARVLRKRYETEVEEPERQAYARLAKARFSGSGLKLPPDATFTLRLAFGVVKGYRDGAELPFQTTAETLFHRAAQQKYRAPFNLPRRWLDKKDKLDHKTPMNFVSTADTIGGNSGSPVLNRAAEVVGVNFDRNRHGLVRNYVYTDEQARHISVHSRAVLAALESVYAATALLKELRGK